MNNIPEEDDGSLAFLNIPRDENSRLESEAKKFFTGSSDILYVLKKIKEVNKFPRKVTLRGNGNRYYFE